MKSEIGHCTYHGRFNERTIVTQVRGLAIIGTGSDCDSTSQLIVLGVQEVWSYFCWWLREPPTCQGCKLVRSVKKSVSTTYWSDPAPKSSPAYSLPWERPK